MQFVHARSTGLAFIGTTALLAAPALAGPDWLETGDAGSSLSTAQDTTQIGQLTSIVGLIEGSDKGDTEDVYKLQVTTGRTFANMTARGSFGFDAALWLFDAQGFGVLANDNNPFDEGSTGAFLDAPSSDGVTLALPPGNYFLAVTESGNIPLGLLGSFGLGVDDIGDELAPIFEFASDREISGPDGPAGGSQFAAWSGSKTGNGGSYGVVITPTPGGAITLALGGLLATRRRR